MVKTNGRGFQWLPIPEILLKVYKWFCLAMGSVALVIAVLGKLGIITFISMK
jgi:hypothetical protein